MRATSSIVFGCGVLVSAIGPGEKVWDSPDDFAWSGDILQGSAPLTLLPQDKGNESPACLDGSAYGFYFVPSTTGSTKWTINLQGGGWCYDEEGCFDRSKGDLGSSKGWAPTSSCGCKNVLEDGSMDTNCNCIYMPYGDGASFSGFRSEPWPVPSNTSEKLYFRGIKNFDATIDFAFQNGLDKATEFVLAGTSAGGLSTFLHADRVAERLAKDAPDCGHVRAAPQMGYFLDHDNLKHDQNNYTAWMKYIYYMQNLTSGADGGLLPACEEAYPEAKHYCFMSPHMQQFIKIPFFMFNSKYDEWQLSNELQTDWKTAETRAAVLQYGVDFLEQFKPVQSETRNGAFITSCICHWSQFGACPWTQLVLEGKTSYQHYADWYYGKTIGSAAVHIDVRHPNGDGSLDFQQCEFFQYESSISV